MTHTLITAAGLVGIVYIAATEYFNKKLIKQLGEIMSQNQSKVDALAAQSSKAQGEIQGAIANLKDEVEALKAAVADATTESTIDFSGLDQGVQALDDIVPDAPVDGGGGTPVDGGGDTPVDGGGDTPVEPPVNEPLG